MSRIVFDRSAHAFVDYGHYPPATGRRFANACGSAWDRIPFRDRISLSAYWHRWTDMAVFQLVEACPFDTGPYARDDWNVQGQVVDDGHRICIRAGAVSRFAFGVLVDLVGHELSHVFQFARGLTFASSGERELDADVQMSIWGFPPYSVDGRPNRQIATERRQLAAPGGRYDSTPW